MSYVRCDARLVVHPHSSNSSRSLQAGGQALVRSPYSSRSQGPSADLGPTRPCKGAPPSSATSPPGWQMQYTIQNHRILRVLCVTAQGGTTVGTRGTGNNAPTLGKGMAFFHKSSPDSVLGSTCVSTFEVWWLPCWLLIRAGCDMRQLSGSTCTAGESSDVADSLSAIEHTSLSETTNIHTETATKTWRTRSAQSVCHWSGA